MESKDKDRFFSVELKSKAFLKNIALTNGGYENVLIEGTIGKLNEAKFLEGTVLEVKGERGVLRINLTPNEIKRNTK